jgi:hypothetical protein
MNNLFQEVVNADHLKCKQTTSINDVVAIKM